MQENTTPKKRGRPPRAAPVEAAPEERIIQIPLAELHPFPDHPFKVRDDDAMRETAESVREYGVLVPAIVRPRESGGFPKGKSAAFACVY